jgi:hypothetical protein
MTAVAIENFRLADHLMRSQAPPVAQPVKTMGAHAAHALLRYQAAEQNRWYFQRWEVVQLGVGLILLLVLVFGSSESAFTLLLALFLFILVAVQRFGLTPEITSLGRLLDTLPAAPAAEQGRFWALHHFYTGVELVKWLVGLFLGVKLIIGSRRRSGRSRREIDLIDKADDRHIDR